MVIFYILYSKTINKYYIDTACDDITRRLLRYYVMQIKGFTGGGASDWKVVYSEKFETKDEAFSREREIKAWKSRKRIEKLIENKNT